MKDLEVILLSQNLSVVVKGENRKLLKNTSLEYFFQLHFLAFGKGQDDAGQVLSCPCRVYLGRRSSYSEMQGLYVGQNSQIEHCVK